MSDHHTYIYIIYIYMSDDHTYYTVYVYSEAHKELKYIYILYIIISTLRARMLLCT